MMGASFGVSTPRVLIVHIGPHPAGPTYLLPGTGFLCDEVHWPSGNGYRDVPGQPDLVILDFQSSDSMDFSVCSHVKSRTGGVPVIVIGANTPTDCIVSLELGADDYLPRPFHPTELVARARAILRACGRPLNNDTLTLRISTRWLLDQTQRRLISDDGTAKKLNTVEYWLLQHFIAHPNIIQSHEALAAYLCDKQSMSYTPPSMVVFVNGLRAKLEDRAPSALIRTVRGRGYVYTEKA